MKWQALLIIVALAGPLAAASGPAGSEVPPTAVPVNELPLEVLPALTHRPAQTPRASIAGLHG